MSDSTAKLVLVLVLAPVLEAAFIVLLSVFGRPARIAAMAREFHAACDLSSSEGRVKLAARVIIMLALVLPGTVLIMLVDKATDPGMTWRKMLLPAESPTVVALCGVFVTPYLSGDAGPGWARWLNRRQERHDTTPRGR